MRIPKNFESAEYWLNKAYKLRDAFKNYDFSLKRVAIQFPFANVVVATAILGMGSSKEVEENISDYEKKIPLEFWKKIKDDNLIDQRSPIE